MYLLIVREKDKEGAPTEILDVKIVPAKDFDRYAQRAADKKVRAPFRLTRVGEAAGTHLSTRPLILYDKAKKLSIAKNKIAKDQTPRWHQPGNTAVRYQHYFIKDER